jgi:hypothetical protein
MDHGKSSVSLKAVIRDIKMNILDGISLPDDVKKRFVVKDIGFEGL